MLSLIPGQIVFFKKKILSTLISYRVLPMFSSSFSVTGFKLMSLIHLGLVFVQSNGHRSNFILLYMNTQLSQKHLLEVLSSLQCVVFDSL